MRKQKLTPTTKTVDDLYQLHAEGRLDLRPDYQRNSVWPPKARAYLVDTVLIFDGSADSDAFCIENKGC
jgi:hypothetical protein